MLIGELCDISINTEVRHVYCCLFVGEEWPGFDVPPVGSESLWDNEYNPMSAKWPAGPDTPASLQVSYLYSV